MDCREARRQLHDAIDGRLPEAARAVLERHLETCKECASEAADHRRTGEILRLWASAKTSEKVRELDVMWTRVRAGIEERRVATPRLNCVWKWALFSCVIFLALLSVLLYPASVGRGPIHPNSYEVSVESLESDSSAVALLDRGRDYPRVIWILDDERT